MPQPNNPKAKEIKQGFEVPQPEPERIPVKDELPTSTELSGTEDVNERVPEIAAAVAKSHELVSKALDEQAKAGHVPVEEHIQNPKALAEQILNQEGEPVPSAPESHAFSGRLRTKGPVPWRIEHTALAPRLRASRAQAESSAANAQIVVEAIGFTVFATVGSIIAYTTLGLAATVALPFSIIAGVITGAAYVFVSRVLNGKK